MKKLITLLLTLALSLASMSACSKTNSGRASNGSEQEHDSTESTTEAEPQELDLSAITGAYDETLFRLDQPRALADGAQSRRGFTKGNFSVSDDFATITTYNDGYLLGLSNSSNHKVYEHFFRGDYLIFREELVIRSIEGVLPSENNEGYEIMTDEDGFKTSCKISIPVSYSDIAHYYSNCSLRFNAENNSFSYLFTELDAPIPRTTKRFDFRGTYAVSDCIISLDFTSCSVYSDSESTATASQEYTWTPGTVKSILCLENDRLYNKAFVKSDPFKNENTSVNLFATKYGEIHYDVTGTYKADYDAFADYPVFYLGRGSSQKVTVTGNGEIYENSTGMKQTIYKNYLILHDELITNSVKGELPANGKNTSCTIDVSVDHCDNSPQSGNLFNSMYASYQMIFSDNGECSIILEPASNNPSSIKYTYKGKYQSDGSLIMLTFTDRESSHDGTTEGVSTMMLYVEDGKIYDNVYRKKA